MRFSRAPSAILLRSQPLPRSSTFRPAHICEMHLKFCVASRVREDWQKESRRSLGFCGPVEMIVTKFGTPPDVTQPTYPTSLG